MKIILPPLWLALGAAGPTSGQARKIKTGLFPQDWTYTLAPGVAHQEVTYDSDGTACYLKIFFPRSFSIQGKTPGGGAGRPLNMLWHAHSPAHGIAPQMG